jgi:hypothetical protein
LPSGVVSRGGKSALDAMENEATAIKAASISPSKSSMIIVASGVALASHDSACDTVEFGAKRRQLGKLIRFDLLLPPDCFMVDSAPYLTLIREFGVCDQLHGGFSKRITGDKCTHISFVD